MNKQVNKVPLYVLVEALVTNDFNQVLEYLNDEETVQWLDRLSNKCYFGMVYNEDATTWEASIAYDFFGVWAYADEIMASVCKCEHIMKDEHERIELECFPKSSDAVYSKTNIWATFINADAFGYLAFSNTMTPQDINFIKSIVDIQDMF